MENYQANEIFEKGGPAPSDYFTGAAWLNLLLPNDEVLNTQIGNVVFEPNARNYWHSHPGGQILVVTDGEGYYQEKGKTIRLIKKGDVVKILPDVKHWHGASPNMSLTHIAINTNTQKGVVEWMEAVTDEEYKSF